MCVCVFTHMCVHAPVCILWTRICLCACMLIINSVWFRYVKFDCSDKEHMLELSTDGKEDAPGMSTNLWTLSPPPSHNQLQSANQRLGYSQPIRHWITVGQSDIPCHFYANSWDSPCHLYANSWDSPCLLHANSWDSLCHLCANSWDIPYRLCAVLKQFWPIIPSLCKFLGQSWPIIPFLCKFLKDIPDQSYRLYANSRNIPGQSD